MKPAPALCHHAPHPFEAGEFFAPNAARNNRASRPERSFFRSKFKALKTPPSHGLTGLAAIKQGAEKNNGLPGDWAAAHSRIRPRAGFEQVPRACSEPGREGRKREAGMECKAQTANGPCGPARICNAAGRTGSRFHTHGQALSRFL